MIHYDFFTLENGLKVYVIPDNTVGIAVMNILYDVGSRDESELKTGFAHLFEHLMFGGSANIPNYDEPLQRVGGENNAYTTPDYTNYYLTLPAANIETGFWLESDRMLSLSFDPHVLEVQRKVVIEEYKQRYINSPYGDISHHLRKLLYNKHPYQWPTIGACLEHIEQATMDDVRDFFSTHYVPNRAIMVVGGNVTTEQVKMLSKKWFEPIPKGKDYQRSLPQETKREKQGRLNLSAKVPQNLFLQAWHIGKRTDDDYFATDLLSDLLGRGKSSRLYQALVKEESIFTSIHCNVSGSLDPGYITIQGYLQEGISFEKAEKSVKEVIVNLFHHPITTSEHEKVVNQAISVAAFGKIELLEKCTQLAFAANIGNPDFINEEAELISGTSAKQIQAAAEKYLREENSVVIHYQKEE